MFPQEKEDCPNGREVEPKEQLLPRQTFSARGEIREGKAMNPSSVSSAMCEMGAVCKTEPGQGELWKVAPEEKGLPCMMGAPTLISAPVLLIIR